MVVALDYFRSKILSHTLRITWVQRIYRDREIRTLVLFSFSLLFNLVAIVISPNLLFYGAPLLLGIPHLFSSFIFSGSSLPIKLDLRLFYLIAIGVLGSFCLQDLRIFEDYSFLTLALALASTFFLIGRAFKLRRTWISPFFYGSIIVSFGFFPIQTAILLLFAHNFIAFVYWYLNAQNTKAKSSVILAFLILCLSLFGLFILNGPALPSESLQNIHRMLLGGDGSSFDTYLIQVFLITQSIHYFIWLKAIPDYASSAKTPGGFSYTFNNLTRSLGKQAPRVCIFLGLVMLATAAFFGLEGFRRFYICLSAYHGIFEIAALGALLSIRSQAQVS